MATPPKQLDRNADTHERHRRNWQALVRLLAQIFVSEVFILPRAAADPTSPIEGQTYYNTATKHVRTWNGTAWKQLDN